MKFLCIKIWNFHACNDIFMHERDISMYENKSFISGMIFLPQRFSWVIWLCTILCTEISPMKTLGQSFHFHASNFISMHENEIFMHQIFTRFFHA